MIDSNSIYTAYRNLKSVVKRTPLEFHQEWSDIYGCKLYYKREDQQLTRSYKIRGALNCITQVLESSSPEEVSQLHFVCASAGNHAQGFAWVCAHLKVKGTVFMPKVTPKQKLQRTLKLGGQWIKVELEGDTFDQAYQCARTFESSHGATFIHPFDDPRIIQGQGTVGLEILEQFEELTQGSPDVLLCPIGGGGLSAGIITWFKTHSPQTEIIGVEPEGAPAMLKSLQSGQLTSLDALDTFVDGAAVQTPGSLNFQIIKENISQIVTVPEGKVCTSILEIYNDSAIVLEPAGALTIAALDQLKNHLQGKTVVVVMSGGNNDINRMAEIQERSLLYEGLKHYFILEFAQRAGALRDFLDNILGPTDDITRFEYVKKTKREGGPALVGIEVQNSEDFELIKQRMVEKKMAFTLLNEDLRLFELLV